MDQWRRYVSTFSLSPVRAQLEALDFAGGGLRQLRHELDPARIFVRRELVFHVLLQRRGEIGVCATVGSQHDISLGLDQPVLVGLPDHRGFEHRRVGSKRRLDFERRDPDAADLEHVVAAAAVGEIAVVALDVLVAAARPGPEKGVAAFFAVVPVNAALVGPATCSSPISPLATGLPSSPTSRIS